MLNESRIGGDRDGAPATGWNRETERKLVARLAEREIVEEKLCRLCQFMSIGLHFWFSRNRRTIDSVTNIG